MILPLFVIRKCSRLSGLNSICQSLSHSWNWLRSACNRSVSWWPFITLYTVGSRWRTVILMRWLLKPDHWSKSRIEVDQVSSLVGHRMWLEQEKPCWNPTRWHLSVDVCRVQLPKHVQLQVAVSHRTSFPESRAGSHSASGCCCFQGNSSDDCERCVLWSCSKSMSGKPVCSWQPCSCLLSWKVV